MKLFIISLLAFFLFQINSSTAQGCFGVQNFQSLGGSTQDYVQEVVQANGSTYVAGIYSSPSISFWSTQIINKGFNDFYLASYNAQQSLNWVLTIGGSGYENRFHMQADAGGNTYVAGTFYSDTLFIGQSDSLIKTNAGSNQYDAFIAKFSPSGNLLWIEQLQGIYTEEIRDLILVNNQYLYAAVYSFSPFITAFNQTISAGQGSASGIVLKCDTAGTLSWHKQIGGVGFDAIEQLTADANSIYFAGSFTSASISVDGASVSKTGTYYNGMVGRIVQSSGYVAWIKKAYSATNHCYGQAITTDGFGTIYPVFFSFGSGLNINNSAVSGNGVVVSKFYSSGSSAWHVSDNSTLAQVMSAQFLENTIHVVGDFGSFNGFTKVIRKVSSSGVSLPHFEVHSQDARANSITPVQNGFLLAGNYNWSITNNGQLVNSQGQNDGFWFYYGGFVSSILPSSTTACIGDSLVIQGDTISNAMYSWLNNGVTIPNETNSSLMVTQSGNYQLITSNGLCVDTSLIRAINFGQHTVNQLNDSVCNGDSLLFNNNFYSLSGQYTDTLTSFFGCDSVVTLDLTINPTYNFTQTASICQGDSFLWQGNYYFSGGPQTSTFTTINGCDSVYNLQLSVLPLDTTNLDTAICQGDSIELFGASQSTAGIYSSIAQNQNNCDSLIEVNLTVYPTYNFTQTASICQGDSFLWQGNYYFSGGPQTSFFTTINGCDSVYNLQLSVLPLDTTNLDTAICQGDSIELFGAVQSTAGVYSSIAQNQNNCDSLIEVNLTVYPTYYFTQTASICYGDSFLWQGNYYSNSTQTSITFQSNFGCDSIVQLDLIELDAIDIPILTHLNDSIVSNYSDTVWHNWFKNNQLVLNGFVNSIACTPYDSVYCFVEVNACNSEPSLLAYCDAMNLNEVQSTQEIVLYPNPSSNWVQVQTQQELESLVIRDVAGRFVVHPKLIDKKRFTIEQLPKGFYWVEINNSITLPLLKL